MNNDTKTPDQNAAMAQFSVEALAKWGENKTVYIRGVLASKLKAEGLLPAEAPIEADTILYAVHAADGTPLAIVDKREIAFAGARQYDMEPVSVH